MLFSLLVQEITNELRSRGCYGILVTPDIIELSILLFADDIVLIADTVFELQNKLDVLYEVATKLGLIVNIDKSKVVVFRKEVVWRVLRSGMLVRESWKLWQNITI